MRHCGDIGFWLDFHCDVDQLRIDAEGVLLNPPTTDQPTTDQLITDHRPTNPKFTDSLAFHSKDLIIKKIFILQNTNTAGKM